MMNQQIQQEACDWFVRMRDGEHDALTQNELMDWLRRSPDHVSAYLDVAAIWTDVRNVDADSNLDIAARIALARADRDVAELPSAIRERIPRRPLARVALIAASSLLVCGLALFAQWRTSNAQEYATQLGELRLIELPDGSTVELNSRSRIAVRFNRAERRIELSQGQALFKVATDTARPFLVQAGDVSVRALGTIFDVYRRQRDAVITVVEGKVLIGSTEMSAGKQLVVARQDRLMAPKNVNPEAATAWRRRQLAFEFAPLAEVAEEFNRYNARQLKVEGEKLRAFKITALFESTDPASLVRYLKGMPEVAVTENAGAIVIAPSLSSKN